MNWGQTVSLWSLLFAGLISGPTIANESIADRVIARYAALETYCDRLDSLDRRVSTEVRRCYTRDGRYKRIEQYGDPHWRNAKMSWGDADHEYYWLRSGDGTTRVYFERPARNRRAGGLPDDLTARALAAYVRYVDTEDEVRAALEAMEVVGVDAETTILERRQMSRNGNVEVVNRVWVRNSDALIVRGEERWYGDTLNHGEAVWSAAMVGVRNNLELDDSDLTEMAPLLYRYNLVTRRNVFVSALVGIAFVMGVLISVVWRRPRNWARVWRFYLIAIGITVALLAGLTLLALILPGEGHPSGIIVPMILGVLCAVGAIVLAGFAVGMQLTDRVLAETKTKTEAAGAS